MVKLLINYVNKWGKTPLFISCENENEAIVKYLVEHGADLKNDNLGETLLFNACENGNEAIGLNDTQLCLRGFTVTPPIVGSAFPRGSRRVLIYGRRRRTGMAVNHTPILLYGEDQSLHNNEHNKWDILNEMYIRSVLSIDRFQIIMKYFSNYINISSLLIRNLFNNNNNREEVSISDLNKDISDNKYKNLTYDSDYQRGCGKYLLIKFNRGKEINSMKVEFLVEHGVNINKENSIGETSLIKACKIEHRANINKKNVCSKTPLFISCKNGNIDIVKYLVKNGVDVNTDTIFGETPLFYKCRGGNVVIVKYLIEHGADINKENNFGEIPLFISCEKGNVDIVKYLVEHGADVNKKNDKGETPLFYKCRGGNVVIVKYLIEHGADINKENNFGEIPLFISCEKGNVDIVKYLVEHGADVNKKNDKADVNKKNNFGKIPLCISCENGNVDIIKYLVEHGTDMKKENDEVENGNNDCGKIRARSGYKFDARVAKASNMIEDE
ncbi:ankyrin repeat-containing domain protein [Neocallimastix lanati (nom. inval.)]|nr:ankyrin repeat-containing domain protein [Neocallimastix sp. JGI-2020a]